MNASNTRPPLERRGLDTPPQVETTGGRPWLSGYAVRFGQMSEPIGAPPFREVIYASALAQIGSGREVKALVGHDASRCVGSSKAGTLQLQVDAVGLRFRLNPPDSPAGLDLVEAVKRRDMTGVSIGFRVPAGGDTWRRGERPPVRELRDLDLFELSFVSWPCYSEAGVQIEQRALDHAARIVAGDRLQMRRDELRALRTRLEAYR